MVDYEAVVAEIIGLSDDDIRNLNRDVNRKILLDLGATKSPPWEKDKLCGYIRALVKGLKGAPKDFSDLGGLGISIPAKYFKKEKRHVVDVDSEPKSAKKVTPAKERKERKSDPHAEAPSPKVDTNVEATPVPKPAPAAPSSTTPGATPGVTFETPPPGGAGGPAAVAPSPSVAEVPEQRVAREEEERRRERIKKSQEKRKCTVCGNMARSSCPFRACKSCCSKANNQCQIHVLTAVASPGPGGMLSPDAGASRFSTPAVSGAGSLAAQAATNALQAASQAAAQAQLTALRGSSYRHVPATNDERLRNLREAIDKYQQEIVDVSRWREGLYRAHDAAEQEIQDEALQRYLDNCDLLEEVMYGPVVRPGAADTEFRAQWRSRAEALAAAPVPAPPGNDAKEEALARMAAFESLLDKAYSCSTVEGVEAVGAEYCQTFKRRPFPPLPGIPPPTWRKKAKPMRPMPIPPAVLQQVLDARTEAERKSILDSAGVAASAQERGLRAVAAAAGAPHAMQALVEALEGGGGAEGAGAGAGGASAGALVAAAGGAGAVAMEADPAPGSEGQGVEGQEVQAGAGAPPAEAAPQASVPAPTAAHVTPSAAGGARVGEAASGPEEWELEPMEPEELVSIISRAVVRRVPAGERVAGQIQPGAAVISL